MGFQAWLSGWRQLAATYRADVGPEDVSRTIRSLTAGRWAFPRVHYRRTMGVRYDGDRMLLRPHVLFRWAHPPLAIPRAEIAAREHKGYLRRYVSLRTQAHPGISLHLPLHHYGWPEDITRYEA